MKSTTVIVMLFLIPLISFSQYDFRPVIDTSAACSWYVEHSVDQMPNPLHEYKNKLRGIFYIVEQMPRPKTSANEIEAVLKNKVGLNANEEKLNGTMYFQCIINCKGHAGDFQIIHCPENFINICCQAFEVIKEKLKNWHPGMQHGKNVDVFLQIQVKLSEGEFAVGTPFSLN